MWKKADLSGAAALEIDAYVIYVGFDEIGDRTRRSRRKREKLTPRQQ